MTRFGMIGLLLAALVLSACGTGTAAGAGLGALTDADIMSAGLLGAAAGGAAGALTKPSTANLGEPVWE